ncbi:PREDICTED: nuclear envelope integral membrane protein 2 [Nanorana parkeri]|uniref:nuclear envelope integral membrane protein 2 n=1 Tax=Nanorana parkeri TaxID=125878 RepID=UPI000854BC5A|nr:PREDICTED: nuclear envelope integral membrane protein 2 [Nanorana parkeri]
MRVGGFDVWSAVCGIVHTLLVGCARGQQASRVQFVYSVIFVTHVITLGNSCTYLNQSHGIVFNKSHCFCYKAEWNFKQAWSTIQIQVQSQEETVAVSQLNKLTCVFPEHPLVSFTCLLHYLRKPADSKLVNFSVGCLDQDFCFDVNIAKLARYEVTFTNIWFNPRLFALFISGFLLFCFAGKLSRASSAFYVAGITVGVTASTLLLILVLKRFISKHSTFWLLASTCLFLSAYAVHFVKENINWIWTDNKHYVLGYFVTVGFLSFVTCYRHGPLSSERSIALFTWTLQIIACFLIYFGLAISEVAFAIIAGLASCKGLYYFFKVLHYVKRLIMCKKPVVKLLTEEEYREQAEVETTKALEELRDFCRSTDINSWLVISRLSSPNRFAQFILGSNHVSSEEVSTHEEQYGLGSYFLEEQLFMQDQESQNTQRTELVPQQNEHAEDYPNAFDPSDSERSFSA